jgi:glycosyltransferase involved in cell wall biosynthesis
MKILYIAPFRDFSGYASVARGYLNALSLYIEDGALAARCLLYDGGNHQSAQLDRFSAYPSDDVDVILQHTTPNEMEAKEGAFNVGLFCWETDRLPLQWVNELNRMQLVIVPTKANWQACKISGVTVPVEIVPYTYVVGRFDSQAPKIFFPSHNDAFKFLSIFQFSKKKGFDALLKAYLSEFSADDNVLLVVKTYLTPHDTPEHQQKVIQLVQTMKTAMRRKSYAPIHIIHGVSTSQEIDSLYKSTDCYVLPSRGEGWGVPHFDALGFGRPAIAVDGTGPSEFIRPFAGWVCDGSASPVFDMPHPLDYLYTGDENWIEPDCNSLRACMRDAYTMWETREVSDWNRFEAICKGRAAKFSPQHVGLQLLNVIEKHWELWKCS